MFFLRDSICLFLIMCYTGIIFKNIHINDRRIKYLENRIIILENDMNRLHKLLQPVRQA